MNGEQSPTTDQSASPGQETYTFRGRTFTEVAQKVTKTLGRNAYIVEKRQVKPDGKKGLIGGLLGGNDEFVEVIASTGSPAPSPVKRPKTSLLQKTYCPRPEGEADTVLVAPTPRPPSRRSGREEAVGTGVAAKLEQMEENLRQSLTAELQSFMSLQACGGLPPVSAPLQQAYRRLVDEDVHPEEARELVEYLYRTLTGAETEKPSVLTDRLCLAMAERMPVAGPIALGANRPTVVAVTGPTGVGKTTAIAKLAVEFVYRRGRSVGILNEDVRRPGAEAQLRNLSQLLGVSVAAAETPERALEELRHMRDLDLVLVDTVGRVPGNDSGMEGLKAFLQAVRPDETHTVVSCDASVRSALLSAVRFKEAGSDRLIVSKIDEAPVCGLVQTLAARGGLPLSYVTTGQSYTVPVTPADGVSLARLILGCEEIEQADAEPEWIDEEADG